MPIADAPPLSPPAQVRHVDTFDVGASPPPQTTPSSSLTTGKIDLGIGGSRCPAGQAGEIVVCARNPEENRLRGATGPTIDPILPKTETKLGSATLDLHMESAGMANGQMSNRVMVGVKLPF
ncbi:hypothetical protein [Novosphingobium sp. 9]|uniref:hypothetical protein n=1 Tax=Novosphingobium sp. 9 TaxID=2025349 RepID=UPI0021B62EA1|nr:hypothetical protein [Novosphingobium sp. 9]